MPRWDLKTTRKCIQCYKKHECLWNPYCDDFKNQEMRTQALADIAKEMALEDYGIYEIRNKLKSLRSTYCQVKQKMDRSNKTGSKPYVAKLKWMQDMEEVFLKVEKTNLLLKSESLEPGEPGPEEKAESPIVMQEIMADSRSSMDTRASVETLRRSEVFEVYDPSQPTAIYLSHEKLSEELILKEELVEEQMSQELLQQKQLSHKQLSQDELSQDQLSLELVSPVPRQSEPSQELSPELRSQQLLIHERLSQQRLTRQRLSQKRLSQQKLSPKKLRQKQLSQERLSHQRVSQQRQSQQQSQQQPSLEYLPQQCPQHQLFQKRQSLQQSQQPSQHSLHQPKLSQQRQSLHQPQQQPFQLSPQHQPSQHSPNQQQPSQQRPSQHQPQPQSSQQRPSLHQPQQSPHKVQLSQQKLSQHPLSQQLSQQRHSTTCYQPNRENQSLLYEVFGKSVAIQLQNLSMENALLAQQRIQGILTEIGIKDVRERQAIASTTATSYSYQYVQPSSSNQSTYSIQSYNGESIQPSIEDSQFVAQNGESVVDMTMKQEIMVID